MSLQNETIGKVDQQAEDKFSIPPDERSRKKMLSALHARHPQYLAEPKRSLVKLLQIIKDSNLSDEDRFQHQSQAAKLCGELIDLVNNPNAPRGPAELGKAFALIYHLVASGLLDVEVPATSTVVTLGQVISASENFQVGDYCL